MALYLLNRKVVNKMQNRDALPTSKWHIIYTCPNREKKVYNELLRRKIDAFLPMTKTFRRWSDRVKLIETPLFFNYVFVNISVSNIWTVKGIDGVVRFVTFNGMPSVVKEDEIQKIKKIISYEGEIKQEKNYLKGEKVKVTCGPLVGLEGEVLYMKGMLRLHVILESVKQIISVDIDKSSLAKID